jgi:GT2 family glycosyltransferase
LFLADDFIPERYCFEAHVRFHDGYPEEHYVGVGPAFFSERLRRDPFRRWLEDSGELFGTSFTHLQPEVVQSYFYGANTSLKRSFIDRVGGFDENFRYHTTDDYEFGVRARKFGMKAVFLPDARAIHEHDVNLAERAASVRRSGSSNVWLERKHPDLPPPSAHYRRTAWRYRLRSWRAWLRYLRTGADADLVASWRSWIMSAGVAGYAAARAKNG